MGKGSNRRPQAVSDDEMERRWALVFDDRNNATYIVSPTESERWRAWMKRVDAKVVKAMGDYTDEVCKSTVTWCLDAHPCEVRDAD